MSTFHSKGFVFFFFFFFFNCVLNFPLVPSKEWLNLSCLVKITVIILRNFLRHSRILLGMEANPVKKYLKCYWYKPSVANIGLTCCSRMSVTTESSKRFAIIDRITTHLVFPKTVFSNTKFIKLGSVLARPGSVTEFTRPLRKLLVMLKH